VASYSDKLKLIIGAQDKASGTLKKIGGAVAGIGAAYLGWRGVKNIIGGIVEAGMNYEKVWNDVAASLERHNFEVKESLKSVQDFSDKMQTLTGISDEVIGTSIQAFLDYNNDLKTSMNLVKVASDLAVGGHMDMKAAVDLVGKASVGYTGTLSRYGIIIDESIPKSEKFAEAIKQINQRFGGAAAARMKTSTGQMALLSQRVGDLKEKLFLLFSDHLINVIKSASTAVSGFIKVLDELTSPLGNLTEPMETFDEKAVLLEKTLKSGGAPLYTGLQSIDNLFDNMGKSGGSVSKATKALETFEETVSRVVKATPPETLAKLFGASEEEMKAWESRIFNVGRFSSAHADATDTIKTHSREMVDGIAESTTATNDAAGAAEELAEVISVTIPEAIEIEEEALEHSVTMFTAGIAKQKRSHLDLQAATQRYGRDHIDVYDAVGSSMSQSMSNAVSRIVGSLDFLQTKSTGVFKNMASDFIQYFIEEILKQVAEYLVVELLKYLAMFDVYQNDMMAKRVGADYASYFSQGVMEGIKSANLAGKLGGVNISGSQADMGMAADYRFPEERESEITIITTPGQEYFARDVIVPQIQRENRFKRFG